MTEARKVVTHTPTEKHLRTSIGRAVNPTTVDGGLRVKKTVSRMMRMTTINGTIVAVAISTGTSAKWTPSTIRDNLMTEEKFNEEVSIGLKCFQNF